MDTALEHGKDLGNFLYSNSTKDDPSYCNVRRVIRIRAMDLQRIRSIVFDKKILRVCFKFRLIIMALLVLG